jgi:hypothetical protein
VKAIFLNQANGSTRSLSKTIGFEVPQAMSTRAGQERLNMLE